MKKLAIVFVLGAILLSANASSILEHLYNSTRLRGGMQYDTKNGVKLGYNGSLVFDNGLFGFEIANVGGSLKAIPKAGGGRLGNTTSGSVDYAGEVHVGAHGHHADIGVNGTAGVYAEWEKETSEHGGSIGYNATLTNHANWTANSGDHTAEGVTKSALNVTGHGCHDDEGKAHVKQGFRGGVKTEGTFGDANGNSTNFTSVHLARGGVVKKIFIHHDHNHTGENDLFPQVAYKGKAGIEKADFVRVGDHKAGHLAKGGGEFGGLVWIEHKDDNDTWTTSIKHAKSADFGHKGKFLEGNKTKVIYGGVGTVSALDGAEITATKDGKDLTVGVLKTGELHHAGVYFKKPHHHDEEKLEKLIQAMQERKSYSEMGMDDMEEVADDLGKDCHHKKKVKTFLHAKWAAGKGVHAVRNDDNTIDVDTKGGVIWDARGVDSKHKKPWHHHGGHGYNSTFEIDPNQGKIDNIQVQLGDDTKIVDELQRKFQLQDLHMENLW